MATIAVSNDVSPDILDAFQQAVSKALSEIEASRGIIHTTITATARGGGISVTVFISDIHEKPLGSGNINNPEW